MQNATQTQVNALTADFLKAADAIVIGVHSLGLDTPELQRPYVIKAVCAFTLKSPTAGWSESSSGKIMLDSSHEHYELIKTRVRRVMDALKGERQDRSRGRDHQSLQQAGREAAACVPEGRCLISGQVDPFFPERDSGRAGRCFNPCQTQPKST